MCFAFPEHVVLLWLLVPVFSLLVYGYVRKRRLLGALADERLLRELAGPVDGRRDVLSRVLVFVAISLLLMALSGPQWCSGERLIRIASLDVAFVLDVSNSMRARDALPDRLTRAKQEMLEVSRSVLRGRRSLVVCAGSSGLLCPLTSDQALFETMLDIASPELVELQGTDLGGALRLAGRSLDAVKGFSSVQVIVVASDGEDHAGRGGDVARQLAARGVRVFVIGVGDETPVLVPSGANGDGDALSLLDVQGRPVMSGIDPEVLQRIAAAGGGEFFLSDEPLRAARHLAERLQSFAAEERWVREPTSRTELFPVFVFPALLMLVVAKLVTRRRRQK